MFSYWLLNGSFKTSNIFDNTTPYSEALHQYDESKIEKEIKNFFEKQ